MNQLKLFSNCKITEGFCRDIIIDLEREDYFIIPKALTSYLKDELNIAEFTSAEMDIINEYKAFLLENNLAHEQSIYTADTFLKYETYSSITNAIILINSDVCTEKIIAIEQRLNGFQTQSILLAFRPDVKIEQVRSVCSLFSKSEARYMELITKHRPDYNEKKLIEAFVLSNQRIGSFLFYEANNIYSGYYSPTESIIWHNDKGSFDSLLNRKIQQYHFVSNIKFYAESLIHNPYYHKKMILDSGGNVYKSTVDFKNAIGNILDSDIICKINNSDAFNFSNVSKEKIDVCCKCENRHICPDNRYAIKREDDTWYNKEECNYNPFIAKWKGEEGYLALNECGIHSDEAGFWIDEGIFGTIES